MNQKTVNHLIDMVDEQNAQRVLERKSKKGWLEGYNEKECKTECEKALKILFKLEDNTNYEIKELGEAITILMRIDFTKIRKEARK